MNGLGRSNWSAGGVWDRTNTQVGSTVMHQLDGHGGVLQAYYGLDESHNVATAMVSASKDNLIDTIACPSTSQKNKTASHNSAARKPLHGGVRLEAMDHEISKQKINNLMLA